MNISELDLDSALAQFGLSSFRPGQREVVSAILTGHDCMCVMPTGGGKSLCFQLPAVIRPGLTIVVSPLIALMKDQVDSLGQKGIPACLINSTLSLGEQNQRLQDVASGKYKLVYVAPERLRSNRFMDAIRSTPIQLLAIDEAHCISQWGHDFRPDYARLGRFREWLGDVQTVALTATATPRVREDIVEVLRLRRPKQFMSGFARPNLDLGVVQRQSDREKDEQLESFLKREPGSGIVNPATRKRCDSLVDMIQQKLRIPVGAYHAGMVVDQRRAIQERFMKNELRIIVATNAFGMGIDKPDLRFVVHYNMPGSLEAYYQEAGRAGRDGQQSQCVLLYSTQDRYIQEFFIDNNYPPREIIEAVYEFLCERNEDPIELTHDEIKDGLGLSCSSEAVGSSLQVIARTGVIERLEMGGGLAKVRIDSNLPTLVDMVPKAAGVKRKILQVLERIVGTRRGEDVFVHPRWLLQEIELDRDTINRHLRELTDKLDAFDYVPPFRGRATHFLRRGVAFGELDIDFKELAKRKEAEYERLNQVVRYAVTPRCRQAAILDYFGDTDAADCGHCDRCLGAQGWPNLAQRLRGGTAPAVITAPQTITEVGWVPRTDEELKSAIKAPSPPPEPERKRRTDLGTPAGDASTGGATASKTAIKSSSSPSASNSADTSNNTAASSPGDAQPAGGQLMPVPVQLRPLLVEILAAIDRTHGRLGKILIGQFLCGSNNSKVQKLRLHRLSGFGMLASLRQNDAMELVDAYLAVGLLQQQEVNRHRPTVSLSVDVQNGKVSRMTIIERMQLSADLVKRLSALPTGRAGFVVAPSNGGARTLAQTRAEGRVQANTPSNVASEPRDMQAPDLVLGAHGGRTVRVSPSVESGAAPQMPGSSSNSSSTQASVPLDDWSWTWQMFVDGYSWSEVMAIRRKTDLELATDLQHALRQNKTVQRTWLVSGGPSDSSSDSSSSGDSTMGGTSSGEIYPTVGQQRLIRELQRRSAAGV